jgi:autotransporter-associated beta strand protein
LAGESTFAGGVLINGGTLNVGSLENAGASGPLGNSAADNSGNITFGGGTLQFSSVNQNDYSGRFSTAAGQPISIDTAGQNVEFATALTSSGGTFTKLGDGTLTLTSANTYSGNTTISAGSLILGTGGSIANSPIIDVNSGGIFDVSGLASYAIGAGQTLAGSGNVNGAVTVNGTVSPGETAAIGTLRLNTSSLTLHGAAVFRISKTGLIRTNDQIANIGAVSYSGTLVVNVTSGTTLAVGDTFNLFSASSSSGNFTSISSPSSATFTFTPSSGVLTVTSVVSTNPATADFKAVVAGAVGSQTLHFSWAPDHLGWQLYTNAVSLTATGSWFPVPGSAAVTNEIIAINPVLPNVFFQLRYP